MFRFISTPPTVRQGRQNERQNERYRPGERAPQAHRRVCPCESLSIALSGRRERDRERRTRCAQGLGAGAVTPITAKREARKRDYPPAQRAP